jgi:hypothetical protein
MPTNLHHFIRSVENISPLIIFTHTNASHKLCHPTEPGAFQGCYSVRSRRQADKELCAEWQSDAINWEKPLLRIFSVSNAEPIIHRRQKTRPGWVGLHKTHPSQRPPATLSLVTTPSDPAIPPVGRLLCSLHCPPCSFAHQISARGRLDQAGCLVRSRLADNTKQPVDHCLVAGYLTRC